TDRRREEAVEALPAERRSDPEVCEGARRRVPPVVDRYPLGALLVQRGQPITEPQRNLVEAETRAFLDSQSSADHFRRGAALFLVFSLLAMLVVLYVGRFQQGLAQGLPKVVGACALGPPT